MHPATKSASSSKKSFRLSVRAKAIGAVAVAALVVVLASSITGYYLRQAALLEEFQILTQSIASTGAIGISGDDLGLISSNEDVEEPEFQFIKERLEKIRDANGLKNEEIYILRPIELAKFTTEFVVMPGDKPFVGNAYTIRPENRDAFRTVFEKGRSSGTNIYKDEHGTWISAYAPIFDKAGKVSGVLEVDSEISRYLARAQKEFFTVLAVALGAFVFALVPGVYLVNRLTAGLRVLKVALDKFDAGHSDAKIELSTGDELEEVADSFNSMTTKLTESQEHLVETNVALLQRTDELNSSLTLTNTIMETVQETLMLINDEGKIEPGYSSALEKMFGRTQVEKLPFVDLIRDRVSSKTYDLTVRFINLLFNESKTNHLIPKLNPLKEVEIVVQGPKGQMQAKFLSFSFDRVWRDQKIIQALVTVEDITPRIALTRELKESAARLERQAELLFGVIHVEPRLLKEFIEGSRSELESISEHLRASSETTLRPEERQAYFSGQAEHIFRCVHRIKGEAALLKVGYYESAAHQFEEKLAKLRGKPGLDGNDFVPIVLELSQMIQSFDDMTEVINRITTLYGGSSPIKKPEIKETDTDLLHLGRLAQDLAKKRGKAVQFTSGDLSSKLVPDIFRKPLRDILVQFIRNSVVHGLENPADRKLAGKSDEGRIQMEAFEESGWLRLVYSDDGKGLNYETMISRAQEMEKTEPGLLASLIDEEKKVWRTDRLNALVFHPGFSTAPITDEDAGRGVGLDFVKQTVEKLGGQISLHTEPGAYCAFVVDLPLPKVNS